MDERGTVFNIQHFSVHDGPGIRTVVFLKGCPLRCAWCANPESQSPFPQLAWTAKDCIGCKSCINRLQEFGVHFEDEGEMGERNGLYWDEKKITHADQGELFKIGITCPTKSLHVIGETKTAEQVLSEVEKDEPFYSESSGGITLSGGEPLMQSDFAYKILVEAARRGIHRAIETTAFSDGAVFEKIVSELDYLLVDVKAWNSELHKKWTGVPNENILCNIENARRKFPKLHIKVRTPVIPGVNDSEEEIERIAKFVKSLGANTEHELLKYHSLGKSKYNSLKREYVLGDAKLSDERFALLRNVSEKVFELPAEDMRMFI